jgi:hypothetical protein
MFSRRNFWKDDAIPKHTIYFGTVKMHIHNSDCCVCGYLQHGFRLPRTVAAEAEDKRPTNVARRTIEGFPNRLVRIEMEALASIYPAKRQLRRLLRPG